MAGPIQVERVLAADKFRIQIELDTEVVGDNPDLFKIALLMALDDAIAIVNKNRRINAGTSPSSIPSKSKSSTPEANSW